MANTRSAEKNIRKTARRTLANQSVKSRIRTLRKKVLAAIDTKDVALANAALSSFASAADKAAKTKVLHNNTSARLKSRLALQIANIKA
jgi:small subunit ribosomal protein S20